MKIETAKQLKEAGWSKPTALAYDTGEVCRRAYVYAHKQGEEYYYLPSLEELLAEMPYKITKDGIDYYLQLHFYIETVKPDIKYIQPMYINSKHGSLFGHIGGEGDNDTDFTNAVTNLYIKLREENLI